MKNLKKIFSLLKKRNSKIVSSIDQKVSSLLARETKMMQGYRSESSGYAIHKQAVKILTAYQTGEKSCKNIFSSRAVDVAREAGIWLAGEAPAEIFFIGLGEKETAEIKTYNCLQEYASLQASGDVTKNKYDCLRDVCAKLNLSGSEDLKNLSIDRLMEIQSIIQNWSESFIGKLVPRTYEKKI